MQDIPRASARPSSASSEGLHPDRSCGMRIRAIGFPLAVVSALALALAMSLAPSAQRTAPLVGAGFAFADSCDSCSTTHNPTPDHEPDGPNP